MESTIPLFKVKSIKDATKKYGILALKNYQFHLIARIDDTTQIQLQSIQ